MNEKENIERLPPENNQPSEQNIPDETTVPETGSTLKPLNDLKDLKDTNDSMEVHKHPHHVTHKKKWGEYLLEFLMLFLAVFLGFLAENFREHAVEQDRVKEFSKSLLRDLQADTTAISNQRRSAKLYISAADSLLKLNTMPLEGRNAAQFSFYTRFTYWTVPISWSRNTFEQIKNTGGLRYFKNDSLLKKLLQYDAVVNDVNSEAEANKIRGNMLLTLISSIIEPGLHHELSQQFLASLDTMSTRTMEIFFSSKTAPLENKREKINEMLNMVVVQQRNLRFAMNGNWEKARGLATELISDLKKEYQLE